MPGLTQGLNIGLSGLQASQAAMDVIGHNIANVNTPGYSRQNVALSSNQSVAFGGLQFGTGVTVESISSVRNKFLDLQISQSLSGQSGAQTRYEGIEAVSSAFLDDGTTGLSTQIQSFFAGLQKVAATPEDLAMRTNLVGTAQSMVSAFKSRYQMLTDQATSANGQVASLVNEVNTLTTQIASLNDRIATETSPGVDSDARDQRKTATDKLAGLVGIQVYEDDKSRLQITLDSGAAVLVSGTTSYKMTATVDAALGNHLRVDVALGNGAAVANVTDKIKGGKLGGNLDLRDNILPGFMRQLDELAAGISAKMNLANRAGFGLPDPTTGVYPTGNDLFQGGAANGANGLPAIVTAASHYKGMVNAWAVNAAVVASPGLIAAASAAGTPGDNANMKIMAKFQTALGTVDTDGDGVGDSGPFSTVVGGLTNTVGTKAQEYQATVTNLENLNTALQGQRDSASSVSLDEEAAKLLTFQRGYQASARFINVVSQLTDQLINELGR